MVVKKILFPLLDSNKGGNILSALSICKNINKKNYRVYILLISSKKKNNKTLNLFKKFNFKDISLIQTNSNKNSISSKLIYFYKLIYFFLSKKIDVVHTNDGYLNFYFSILKIIFGFKLILHIRNTDNSRRNYLGFFFADKIICISKFVKKIIPKIFHKKIIVLYNFVEMFEKDIKVHRKHVKFIKGNINKKVLLFISNIHSRKKPEIFLKILKKLNQNKKTFLGLMVFQSNNAELINLKKLIKINKQEKNLLLLNNFPMHYWVPVVKKLKSKILLVTSKAEPLGRNIIESILKGIYVIANDSGGHREIIDNENGFLINTNKINETKKVIEKLFKKKITPINKKLNIKNIKNKFQNKDYFRKIEDLYSQ